MLQRLFRLSFEVSFGWDSRLSNVFSTSRKLSLAGIIVNIVMTAIVVMVLFFVFSSLSYLFELIPEIPFEWFPTFTFDWIIWVVGFIFIFQIILGILLPAIGYMKTHPESKNLAAALFIVSGVLTIAFIGGILLIVAGVLVLVEEFDDEYPSPKAEVRSQAVTKDKPICSKCSSTLMGDETFCPICGAKVS